MRPEMRLPTGDPEAVLKRLGVLLAGHPSCTGTVFRKHAVMHMRPSVRHFWSPYLYLEAQRPDPDDEDGPDAPQIHGRFAPHPNVWTLFMAIYGVLGMLGLLGLMYGISQWWLDWTPWALAAFPAAAALIGFVYGAAFIGQGLGASQMYELRSLLDDALEAPAAPPTARSDALPPDAQG